MAIDAQDSVGPAAAPSTPRARIGMATLSLGTFLVGAMLTIVIPILPNIAQEIGGEDIGIAVQLLIAMPMLGLVIGGLGSALLFRHFQPRTVFLGGLVAYGLVGVAGAFVSLPVLVGSRLLIGMIAAAIAASSTALVGERVPDQFRPRVLGLSVAGAAALGIIAMIASGRVADAYGWRASFLLFPIVAALMFLLAATCSKPSRAPERAEGGAARDWRALAVLWPVFAFVILVNMTAFTTNSQSSFVLADLGIASAEGRARMMGINQALIFLAAILFPVARRFVGMAMLPTLILGILGVGLLLFARADAVPLAAVGLALLGIGNGLLFPYQTNLLLQRAAPDQRGQAAGLVVSCQFLADAINPVLLGPVIILLGLRTAIAWVGIATLIGCAAALLQGLRLRRTDHAPASVA
ncbi:MAG: MFS transporter [Pseudomonadota bacterium]